MRPPRIKTWRFSVGNPFEQVENRSCCGARLGALGLKRHRAAAARLSGCTVSAATRRALCDPPLQMRTQPPDRLGAARHHCHALASRPDDVTGIATHPGASFNGIVIFLGTGVLRPISGGGPRQELPEARWIVAPNYDADCLIDQGKLRPLRTSG